MKNPFNKIFKRKPQKELPNYVFDDNSDNPDDWKDLTQPKNHYEEIQNYILNHLLGDNPRFNNPEGGFNPLEHGFTPFDNFAALNLAARLKIIAYTQRLIIMNGLNTSHASEMAQIEYILKNCYGPVGEALFETIMIQVEKEWQNKSMAAGSANKEPEAPHPQAYENNAETQNT